MAHTLPTLPYAYDALEPYFDEQTMRIHHTKHHQTYIDKLNAALEGHTDLQRLAPEDLLRNLVEMPDGIQTAVRNHGGGHANHTFFWSLLGQGAVLEGPIVDALNAQFGDFATFQKEFSNTAALLFGSGWTWLVADGSNLQIITTPNQDSPISQGKHPILGLDVWEHAYYLKYQNRRPEYIDAFFNVINWAQVNANLAAAS